MWARQRFPKSGGVEMNLEYSSLNRQLRKRFPVLNEPQYTKMIGGISAGPYVVFGILFNQYLVDIAHGDDLDGKSVAAGFIEAMAATPDERVSNMLISEVLPTLVESQAMVNAYWSLLGPSTRRRMRMLSPRLTANVEFPSSG